MKVDNTLTIRYKELKNGKFSVYFDIYNTLTKRRKYEFLSIYTSEDYTNSTKILKEDRVLVMQVKILAAQRQRELFAGLTKRKEVGFLDWLVNEVKYKTTNVQYNKAVLRYTNIVLASTPKILLSEITIRWGEKFINYLLTKTCLSKNTIRSYVQVLKHLLNRAVKQDLLDKNPLRDLPVPRYRQIERTTLTIDEVRVLWNTDLKYGHHLKEAFLFACFVGLRLGDIRTLTWDSIGDNQIQFRPNKTPEKIVIVPLSIQAQKILDSLERNSFNNRVFWKFNLNKSCIHEYLKWWGLKAGIKQHLHFHASRHTFATLALSSDIDVVTVKEMLGHSKLEMTLRYAKIVDQKKHQEMKKFPYL